MRTRLLLTIALLASAPVLGACGGGNDSSNQAKIDAARAQGAAAERAAQKRRDAEQAQKKLSQEVKKLQKQVKKGSAGGAAGGAAANGSSSSGSGGGAGAGSSCGGNLSVGSNTSCAFGVLVMRAYFQNGGGSGAVSAYSPVTQRTYTMTCTAGAPTVCRGGNNATVYIR